MGSIAERTATRDDSEVVGRFEGAVGTGALPKLKAGGGRRLGVGVTAGARHARPGQSSCGQP